MGIDNFLHVFSPAGFDGRHKAALQPSDMRWNAHGRLFQIVTGGMGRVLCAMIKDGQVMFDLIGIVSAEALGHLSRLVRYPVSFCLRPPKALLVQIGAAEL